jgi:hypothetical protein
MKYANNSVHASCLGLKVGDVGDTWSIYKVSGYPLFIIFIPKNISSNSFCTSLSGEKSTLAPFVNGCINYSLSFRFNVLPDSASRFTAIS